MYVLGFLNESVKQQLPEDPILCEYRLVCSGVLYGGDVKTLDWTKGPYTRVILDKPIYLVVASETHTDYPQELSLRFETSLVTEQRAGATNLFHPDEEIARDLAALLSLLCRRLVIVGGKIRRVSLNADENFPDILRDWPIGIISSLNTTHWERHPSVIVYSRNGIEIIDYNPKPKPVHSAKIAKILSVLPKMPNATSIVRSARLYALALERMHKDVDISYQLLIACIENIASDALKSFKPDESEIISIKKKVADLALSFGLSKEQSYKLAIEAAKGMGWNKKKFVKFLVDNISDELWVEDDVFNIPEHFIPKREDFKSAVKGIYDARGRATHSGEMYPPSAGIGLGPKLPSRQLFDAYYSESSFPPLPWFERVVNIALSGFIQREMDSVIGMIGSNGSDDALSEGREADCL